MTTEQPNPDGAHGTPRLRVFVGIAMALMLTGCNPKAIPTVIFPAKNEDKVIAPAPLGINLLIRENINPDAYGNVSPAQVRVFLTEDKEEFSLATFEQVFEFDNQSLGVKPTTIKTVRSGTVESFEVQKKPEHRLLAVAVGYRDISRSKWIETVELNTHQATTINFIVSSDSISHQRSGNETTSLPDVKLYIEE